MNYIKGCKSLNKAQNMNLEKYMEKGIGSRWRRKQYPTLTTSFFFQRWSDSVQTESQREGNRGYQSERIQN